MFELIGGIFSFAFGMIEMCFGLVWGAVQFVFGLLGGIFSLLLSLGGFFLAGALVLVAIFRRKDRKNAGGHPYAESSEEPETDESDPDHFDSFYDQYRTQQ